MRHLLDHGEQDGFEEIVRENLPGGSLEKPGKSCQGIELIAMRKEVGGKEVWQRAVLHTKPPPPADSVKEKFRFS